MLESVYRQKEWEVLLLCFVTFDLYDPCGLRFLYIAIFAHILDVLLIRHGVMVA